MQLSFVVKGKYAVGYTVNNKERYVIRLKEKTLIGGFEMCYDRTSCFNYKALNEMNILFIRRKDWKCLIDDHPVFYA